MGDFHRIDMSSVHLRVADELETMLRQLPPEIAREVGDRAVLAGARVIAREMRLRAPVGEKAHEGVHKLRDVVTRELLLKRTRAGKADRRISLYTVSETQSVSGARIPTENVIATVTAEIGVRSSDGSEGEHDQARPEKVFRIRWRSDVTKKYLLRFENVVYDIVRIDEVGCRQSLDITALAKVN